jgi:cytoskeletal protein RodZ
MSEAIGGVALLFSVAAVVFGVVRFHRARTALREASRDRMNQLMAEMAHHTAPAPADDTDSPTPNETGSGATADSPVGDTDGNVAPVADASAPEAVEQEAVAQEPVTQEPVDVRREMDAFFGGGLPPAAGDARSSHNA